MTMTTAEILDEDEGPAPKTRRSAEETRELIAEMRAANPGISRTELADALGISTRRLFTVMKDSDDPPPPRRTRAPSAPRKTRTDKLAEKLCAPMAKLAMGLSFAMPTVSAVLIQRGEATANALVAIAADHPRMLAALEKVSKVGPATDLAETGIMIAIAASLDSGRLSPDHPMAVITGMSTLYKQTHPNMENLTPPTPFRMPDMPVPGVPVP